MTCLFKVGIAISLMHVIIIRIRFQFVLVCLQRFSDVAPHNVRRHASGSKRSSSVVEVVKLIAATEQNLKFYATFLQQQISNFIVCLFVANYILMTFVSLFCFCCCKRILTATMCLADLYKAAKPDTNRYQQDTQCENGNLMRQIL